MRRACKPSRNKPMSYILDALKRSEAERSRGAVPGLHARQVSSPLPQTARAATGRWWAVGAVALVLAALAAGLWAWRMPSSEPGPTSASAVVSPVVVQAEPLPTMPAPAGGTASRPVLTPDAFVAALRAASAAQRPGPAAPFLLPKPTLAAPAATRSPASVSAAVAPPALVATPVPAPTPIAKAMPAAPAPAASASAPLLGELSDDLRRQIPAMAITGVVYSANPGQRLLLVNNLVLTQGSLVAPELSLEEIQPKSSVFSFRGTRFRVAH